jgi:ferric-dicitrate binding protein FerR (iron transport regulator)
MHSENYIWTLISRCVSHEASAEEIALLNDVLQKDEWLQQRYEILKQFWRSSHSLTTPEDEENKKHIARILEKAYRADISNSNSVLKKQRLSQRKNFRVVLSSAAVIIFIIIGFILFTKKQDQNLSSTSPGKQQQLVAQKGSRNRTILPDGSVVWLNAGSSLFYAGDFKTTSREVNLKGEAFFDVVKQNDHPFIVHANGVDIKVLGTAFNIKSYSEDNRVEATLIRGLIQITQTGKKNQKPVYLHPNEKLVISLTQKNSTEKSKSENTVAIPFAFKLYHIDSTVKAKNLIETSWIYNRLEFRGDSFEELAKKLERWYNVKIIFADEAAKHLSFNGSFENETAEQAFAALQAAVPFAYTIDEQEVVIKSITANDNQK